MQTPDIVSKAFRVSTETAQKFSSLRRDEDRNDNEVFTRMVNGAAQETNERFHGFSVDAVKTLSECHSLLARIEAGLQSSSLIEARQSLQENAKSFGEAASNHKGWFEVLESNLDKSYDAINRALVGFRELLPEARACSAELERFQKELHEKHFSTVKNLINRYEASLEALQHLPEIVERVSRELETSISFNRARLEEASSTRIKALSDGALLEVENLKRELRKGHQKQLWIVAIPSALIFAAMLFLGFFQPAFEKIEYDKVVSQVLEEKIADVAILSLSKQERFLENLRSQNELFIQNIFKSYAESIENAVKDVHSAVFSTSKESGKIKAFAAEQQSLLTAAKTQANLLQIENNDLKKKLSGEWGFLDSLGNSPFLFLSLFLIALLTGFMSARFLFS